MRPCFIRLLQAWRVWIFLPCLALGLIGCASSSSSSSADATKPAKMDPRKVNWDEQVGHFTFDEALARLGPPVVVGEVPDGKFAEWILRRSPQISFGFGVGSSSYGPHSAVGTGVGTSVTPPPHGENLRLKFGPDGVLKEWMRLKY